MRGLILTTLAVIPVFTATADAAAVKLKVSQALSKGMGWWSNNPAFCSSTGAADASGATNPPSQQA